MRVIKMHGKFWLMDYPSKDVLTCARQAHEEGLIPEGATLNIGCTFFCKYKGEHLYVGRKRENGNGWHDVAFLDTSKEDLPKVGELVRAYSGQHADRVA